MEGGMVPVGGDPNGDARVVYRADAGPIEMVELKLGAGRSGSIP
jgi:hypothetical protein